MRLENVRLELLFSWDYLASSKEQMEKISITGMKCSSYHRTQDLWMQATTTLLLTVCTQTGILTTKEKVFLWEEAMLNRLCSAVNWTHLGNHLWAVCWSSLWRCSVPFPPKNQHNAKGTRAMQSVHPCSRVQGRQPGTCPTSEEHGSPTNFSKIQNKLGTWSREEAPLLPPHLLHLHSSVQHIRRFPHNHVSALSSPELSGLSKSLRSSYITKRSLYMDFGA